MGFFVVDVAIAKWLPFSFVWLLVGSQVWTLWHVTRDIYAQRPLSAGSPWRARMWDKVHPNEWHNASIRDNYRTKSHACYHGFSNSRGSLAKNQIWIILILGRCQIDFTKRKIKTRKMMRKNSTNDATQTENEYEIQFRQFTNSQIYFCIAAHDDVRMHLQTSCMVCTTQMHTQ